MTEMPKMEKGARVRGALARVKWAWGERRNEMAITGLRWTVGLLWINSALGKLTNPTYASGFAATNKGFAAKTPFGFYKDFLNAFVIPNASWFGTFVAYGELLVGVALLVGIATHIGAITGFFLNLNFWLASGYTGGSGGSVNILMATVAVLVIVTPAGKWFAVDRWLAEHPLRGLAAKHPKVTRVMMGRKFVA
jgi:thiosulfate dehydrogenase (quinone) large subunit